MNQYSNQFQIKNRVFQRLGQIAASLGSPARLKLIHLLSQSPKTVEELSKESGESIANTSQHLQRLAKEGLVFSTRDGLNRIYQIKGPRIIALWEDLQDLAHELAPELNEAESKLADVSLRSSRSLDEVLNEVRQGKALLLDVRNQIESSSTSIPGALSIPLKMMNKTLGELPKKKTIYVFCRGRYCAMATDAVRILRKSGFEAYSLRESSYSISSHQKKADEVKA